MSLATIPAELLLLLPQYLNNIEDFVNLSSSCRRIYHTLASTPPNTILHLASASSRIFFRPHPHFLVAATARQLRQWALRTPQNLSTLREAFREGTDALFSLCVSKTGLTMTDIRRLHSSRFSIINPASDLIDRCAGKQWHDANYGRDNGMCFDDDTIDVEPERSLFQIIIYGELFGGTMDAILDSNAASGQGREKFDLETRLEFIRYCIPDHACWMGRYQDPKNNPDVQPVGPYTPCKRIDVMTAEEIEKLTLEERERCANENYARGLTRDQVGLDHILGSSLWCQAWRKVRLNVGPDFKEGWRQTMWESAVQLQGWEGLRMPTPGEGEVWKERLIEIRERICTMEEGRRPKDHNRHFSPDRLCRTRRRRVTDAPCLANEVRFCIGLAYGY